MEESDFPREKRFSKYTKEANRFIDPEEESRSHKKTKKNYEARRDRDPEGSGRRFEKKKPFAAGDDSDEDSIEDFIPKKKQIRKDNKDKRSRFVKSKFEEETSAEEATKNKKYSNKPMKEIKNDNNKASEERTAKFEKKATRKTAKAVDDSNEEPKEEALKKQFRRKIRVRIPDSPEDDSDEDNGACKKRSKKGRSQKNCLDEESVNGDGEPEQHTKKIRYSIKFAHEKEKISPTEDDNIIMKIHRGEKKKYRWV